MTPKFVIGTIIRPDNSFRFYKIKSVTHAYDGRLVYQCIKCTTHGKEFYRRKSFSVEEIDSSCTALRVVTEEIKAVHSYAGVLKRRRMHLQRAVNAAKAEIQKIEEQLVNLNQNEVPRSNLQHVSKNISDETRQTFQI